MSAPISEIAGVDSPRPDDGVLTPGTRRRLIELLEAAHAFYLSRRERSWVPDYLAGRGLAIVEAGYAPGGWSTTIDALRADGFTDEELLAAGVATTSRRGTLIDRFRARLMLPMRNRSGDLVGFVGRATDSAAAGDKAPKYLNSPASALFDKSAVLLGLAEGAEALQAGAVAAIVEGPLDAHATTQAGQGQAVGLATCGTALTAAHISALGQVVDLESHPITFAFDDDDAGTAAATKVWPVVAGRTGLDTTRCADLDGHDPAALLKTRGRAALVSAVCEPSRRLVDMHLDAVIARYDLDNALQIPPALEAAARSLGSLVHDDSAASLATMMALADRHQELSPEWVADALVNAAAPAEEPAEPEESNTGGATVYEFPGSHQPTDEEDGHGGGGGAGGGAGGGGDDPRFDRVIVRDRFRATDNGIFKVKIDVAKKKEFWHPLLPLRVRIVGRYSEELGDGTEAVTTHYDLAATYKGEEQVLRGVDMRRWESCSWVRDLPWGVADVPASRERATLRKAITETSDETSLTKMYASLGWHEIGGRWTYVHAGGAIDSSGPVEGIRITEDPMLKPFALPEIPQTRDELRAAVLASTAIMDAIPARLAAPLLGAAYRACLGFSPVTVMPVGPPASGKTGLAALAAQHYAPTARNRRGQMPGAGAGEQAGTIVGLEELRFRAGDLILPLDDLAPDRGTERASARAAEIARSQFNRNGKLRGKREGGSRPNRPPRSLPIVTGEESTTVQSAESRTVSLRVSRGDVDTRGVLPALDSGEEPELRAKLIAGMVRHYAASMPMGDWLDTTAQKLREALYDHAAFDPGADTRHAESVSELATGWRAMLDMALARGALSHAEVADLWSRAWEGLAEAKRHLMAGSAARTPADRVRELLTAALVRRDATLVARNGGMPDNPEKCGWEENPTAGQTGVTHRPAGTMVGWTDGEKIWLQPGAAYPVLRNQAKSEEDPLTFTRVGLGQALADSGVIRTRMRNGIRSTTVNVRLGAESEGGRYAVWEFDYGWLFPGGVDDEDDLPPVPPAPAPAVPPVQFDDVPTIGDDAEPEPEPEPVSAARPDRSSSKHESTNTQTRMSDDAPSFQRSASMRRSAAATSYRAIAAVCEPTCAWLAKPGAAAEKVALPKDAELETLLSELVQLKLGHADGRGRYYGAPEAWGQAWITEDLRRMLGWPATVDASSSEGKVRRSLESAGWKVLGRLGFWTRIAHRDGPRLALVVPEWRGGVETMLEERSATSAELAYRLARYAEVTGIAWQWSPDTTGQQLAIVTRPRLRDRWRPENGGPTKLPAPAGNANRERPFVWQRPPTPDEERMPYVHLYDFNALYAGAARSLPLAWGEFEHVKQPSVDLNRPGYWAIPQHKWEHALLPDPFAVLYRNERDTMIVTTPTLKIARELLDWDIEPVEAWLAVETLAGDYTGKGKPPSGFPGAKGYGRLLDKWAEELLNGRAALAESQVADDAIVATNVKATYAQGVGRFDMRAQRPGKGERVGKHPLWRPDWRHHIIAQGRYAIMRRILKAADTDDRYPLAIMTDAVVYASDVPDWAAAAPTAFNPGNAAGEVSPPASAPMASVVDLLRKGTIPATRGESTPGLADVIKNGGAADG